MERLFPDPVITANVYCGGRLDAALREVVAPAASVAGDEGYCWVMRYGRGGEHLKVRFHGSDAAGETMRQALEEAAAAFFLRIEGEPSEAGKWRPLPPIDLEDEVEEDYPDRTLLWTHYQRSHLTLGTEPFLDDDTYCALFTQALGRAFERIAEAFRSREGDVIPNGARQSLMFNALVDGVAGLGLELEECASYLIYHRDWLLRYLVHRAENPQDRAEQLLARFDQRSETLEGVRSSLFTLAAKTWGNGVRDDSDGSENGNPLRHAATSLNDYLAERIEAPEYAVDPFAENPRFPPTFKILHGIANQIGLSALDEAFAFHLALRAVLPEQALTAVALTP